MSPAFKAHLALFTSALIYGINYTVAKDVMPTYVQPFGFIVLRVIGATTLFWFVFSFRKKEVIQKQDYIRLFICGIFGVAINQLLFFKGLSLTTHINAAIIMTLTPVLVLPLSAVLLKESITYLKISGVILGLSGAVAIFLFKDGFSVGSETIFGDLCVFINASSYGVYLILAKPLMKKYSPFTVIKWVFLFGALIVVPVGFSQANSIAWEEMPMEIYFKIAYVIIGTTFFAYLLNIYALKELSPSVSSSYIYLQPVFATLIALFLGKDTLNFVKLIAAVFIFTGVYLVSKKR